MSSVEGCRTTLEWAPNHGTAWWLAATNLQGFSPAKSACKNFPPVVPYCRRDEQPFLL
jgi:hypothetical protein